MSITNPHHEGASLEGLQKGRFGSLFLYIEVQCKALWAGSPGQGCAGHVGSGLCQDCCPIEQSQQGLGRGQRRWQEGWRRQCLSGGCRGAPG